MDILSHFNAIDYGILVVLALVTLVGLKRGFLLSLMTLVVWLLAFLVAILGSPFIQGIFTRLSSNNSVQLTLSFLIIAVAVLVIGFFINMMLKRIIKSTNAGVLDHVLGGVLGFVVGLLLLTILWFLIQLTSISKSILWQESMLVPSIESIALVIDVHGNMQSLDKSDKKPMVKDQSSSEDIEPLHDGALN